MTTPYILGIGAANVDLMGKSRGPLVMEDSNPGEIGISVGGVTHNICENAAKLGSEVKLMTAVGDDLLGEFIRGHCQKNGVGTEYFYTARGHSSSTYLSLHQPHGEMAVAMSDMRVLQLLPVEFLESHRTVIEGAAAIVVDCGLPQEVLDYVAGEFGPNVPVFADPVSTTYARKLAGSMAGYHTVKPNLLEAEVLSGMEIRDERDLALAADEILDKGAVRVFISMGKDGVYYADQEDIRLRVRSHPLKNVLNATGAGDAFMAGLLHSFVKDFSLSDTLDFSMTASILAMSHRATINPDMSAILVEQNIPRYKLI